MPSEGFAGERALDVARELAEAIAAAHDKGLIHRDLKPANIMITRDERVKVLDFSLAKDVRTLGPPGRNHNLVRGNPSRHHHGHAALHVAGANRRQQGRS